MKWMMGACMLLVVAFTVGCGGDVAGGKGGEGGDGGGATTSTNSTSTSTTSSTSAGGQTTDSATSASASSSSGGAGSECKDAGSQLGCLQCCHVDFAAGADVLQQALFNECACKDTMAVCNAECADSICAAKPITSACSNCLTSKVITAMAPCYYDVALPTCEASKDCSDLLSCSATCPMQ